MRIVTATCSLSWALRLGHISSLVVFFILRRAKQGGAKERRARELDYPQEKQSVEPLTQPLSREESSSLIMLS